MGAVPVGQDWSPIPVRISFLLPARLASQVVVVESPTAQNGPAIGTTRGEVVTEGLTFKGLLCPRPTKAL